MAALQDLLAIAAHVTVYQQSGVTTTIALRNSFDKSGVKWQLIYLNARVVGGVGTTGPYLNSQV